MILYGASGHGKVIADILKECGIDQILFWDDANTVALAGYNVIKTPGDFKGISDKVLISIGNNEIRKKIADKLNEKLSFFNAIHPKAVISTKTVIENGTAIMAGAVINCDTRIGRHCIINTSSSVDHDCVLEDYVHISPNATLCGDVYVGEGSQVGAGSVIIPGIRIGKWCTVGAGAVVIKDVPDYATVIGNPASILTFKNDK
jgi:sugar O-acyltransferase (sialic acid O-acetyltransferase NeuD family)